MALAGRVSEDHGALGIDGDDPDVRVALFEPARHAGDRSPRADADEDVIQQVEVVADLARRELVMRVGGIRVGVLVGPVRVRDGHAQVLDHLQAGFQEPAGVVAFVDFYHRVAYAAQERLVGAGDVGVDHGDEPQADEPGERGEG